MPDLIGHGKTDPLPPHAELTHDKNASLVKSLIETLSSTSGYMVGHSYGGATALRYMCADPSWVERLVLIEPIVTLLLKEAGQAEIFAEYLSVAETFLAQAKSGNDRAAWQGFLDYRNGQGTWENMTEKAQARFCAMTEQGISTMSANLINPTTIADCKSIEAQTLIIYGENTTEPDRCVAELLHEIMPNNQIVVLAGAEHMSPLSHPEEVAEAIRNHLL